MYPSASALVVFSHLNWDSVYQRPQHVLSRLALGRQVYFIEEPTIEPGCTPHWSFSSPCEGLVVCRPHSPVEAHGYCEQQYPILRPLMRELFARKNLAHSDCWFYTPMALPLIEGLSLETIIYDCMDELSAFHMAPPMLLQREAELLRRADVVFTGGPSLYLAKKNRHPNVHCFPSSVDAKHFAQAKDVRSDAPEQRDLPHPRLGFYGVIDERFDVELIDRLALARPSWQFVLVGPVVKIDPARLPRHANVHYYGKQPYDRLPEFLAGWDVCLLPFALNESTRFISPTKTLEYMAAEKPIVSTPITDVAQFYSSIVRLGGTFEEFLLACDLALSASAEDHAQRVAQMRKVLSQTSWDRTASAMIEQIDQVTPVPVPVRVSSSGAALVS